MTDAAIAQLRADIGRKTEAVMMQGHGPESEVYECTVLSAVQGFVKNELRLDGDAADEAVTDIIIDLFEGENGLH
jgi:hypothetical protein